MTRVFPILAAAATVAFLTFGGAAAFAAAVGGHSPGGPAGPSASAASGKGTALQFRGCGFRADQLGLEGPAQRAFLSLCERGNAG
jgi:hypothetical protein